MDVNVTATPPPIAETLIRPAAPEARAGWRRWQVMVPVGLALVIAATLAYRSMAAGRARPAPAPRAVPVVVSAVRQGDVQVTLSGLGSVVPTDAVTIHSRVDGQLMLVKFREGQAVRQGDLLMQIDPRPYEVQLLQAEGQLAKDEAALKNARADLQRYQTLTREGILPQQQLDTQVSTVDQAAAAVKSDQAGVASAKLNLVYCNITAPVSGVAGLRLVDPGNMVHASDATGLVVITPVSPINVVFSIPADHIQHVLANSKDVQRLKVEAYDRDFTKILATGALLAVDNQVDPTTGTVRLKAEFANKDGALFPNQFVNAKLQTDTLHGALTVPAAAVQRSPKGSYVYALKPDNTVEERAVEILLTEGDTIALKAGLRAGEKVVVDGLDKLRTGTLVAATDAPVKAKP